MRLGFEVDDAVFPVKAHLTVQAHGHQPIKPMRSEGALSAAFAAASKGIGKDFSQHSTRHCLAALGNFLCLFAERR